MHAHQRHLRSKRKGAEATMNDIRKNNASIRTTAVKSDLLEPDFAERVICSTLEDLQVGHMDILIINAAFMGSGGTKAERDNLTLAIVEVFLLNESLVLQQLRLFGYRAIFAGLPAFNLNPSRKEAREPQLTPAISTVLFLTFGSVVKVDQI